MIRKESSLFMVFDVESIGLHGEAFAVGWVVIDAAGVEQAAGYISCPADRAAGLSEDREWVTQNVLPHLPEPSPQATPQGLRAAFWEAWQSWKKQGALLAADCAWPVEARFLAQCVDDHGIWGRARRNFEGPYPLIDVASVRLAAGLDPLGTADRLPAEMPAHHPTADARQSARLLVEALQRSRQL